jgi:pathogenesis-related protein 1
MRPLMVPMMLALSGGVQAQSPWAYPQYGPAYPGYGRPYAPLTQSSSPASLSQAMLSAHNAQRAKVGVPPVVWSAQLADVAQDWADHLTATGAFSHRPNNRYGENLYARSGGSASPDQVVGYWAAEARGYGIRANTCSGVCGHYTQIVWSTTHAVGCAVATDRRREVWVCNYDPPGNVIGYRPF